MTLLLFSFRGGQGKFIAANAELLCLDVACAEGGRNSTSGGAAPQRMILSRREALQIHPSKLNLGSDTYNSIEAYPRMLTIFFGTRPAG